MSLGHIAFKNPTHTNGVTSAIVGEVSVIAPVKHPRVWFINNTSTTNKLFISFDGGVNYLTIPRGIAFEADVDDQPSITLKSDGASQPFEILSGHYPRD